jgi:hypothetical protein
MRQRQGTSLTALVVVTLTLTLCAVAPAWAQQRPLVTEDPETVGAGRVLVEAGFDYGRDVTYPVSGLTGNLLRLPLIGVSIGLGSFAELQLDGGFYDRLSITERDAKAPLANLVTATGDSTHAVDDIVVATKIRVVPETATRPGFGIRFATRLPNASNESGLGTDTFDFTSSLLVGKTTGSTRWVGNAGVAIVADPTDGNRQSDLLAYGLSIAQAIHQGVEVVGEVNGRANLSDTKHPGGESRGQFRLGLRYTKGAGRVDAGLIFGLTSRDPGVGFTAGYTYVFNAIKNP